MLVFYIFPGLFNYSALRPICFKKVVLKNHSTQCIFVQNWSATAPYSRETSKSRIDLGSRISNNENQPTFTENYILKVFNIIVLVITKGSEGSP